MNNRTALLTAIISLLWITTSLACSRDLSSRQLPRPTKPLDAGESDVFVVDVDGDGVPIDRDAGTGEAGSLLDADEYADVLADGSSDARSSGDAESSDAISSDAESSDAESSDAELRDGAEPDAGDNVVEGVDLRVRWTAGLSASTLSPGSSFSVDLNVRNQGRDPAAASRLDILLCLEPCQASAAVPAGQVAVPGLGPQSEVVLPVLVTVPNSAATGRHVLVAIVDPAGQVAETDETNNEARSNSFEVTGFRITPSSISFGQVAVGCSASRTFHLEVEPSSSGVTLVGASYATGASAEFSMQPLSTPLFIAGGGRQPINVMYTPTNVGTDNSTFELMIREGTTQTVVMPVQGDGVSSAIRSETFIQTRSAKADILLVIDNSGSMQEEQTILATEIGRAMSRPEWITLDFHVGITTTDVETSGPGQLIGVPRYITPSTPNPQQALAARANVGVLGSGNEQGLEAMRLALSEPNLSGTDAGFLRADADLHVVIISDEEDYSPQLVPSFESFLHNLKAGRARFHAIVGTTPGSCSGPGGIADYGARYISVATQTGGVVESICQSDWSKVFAALSAGTGRSRFPLSGTPSNAASIQVTLDGTPAQNWVYDNATNSIVFDARFVPSDGSTIVVSYPGGC